MNDPMYPEYEGINEFIEAMFDYAKVAYPYDSDNATHECAVLSILGTMDDQVEALVRTTAEVSKLRAAMHEIAPYKDVIICYASTCSEHEGNRVSRAFDKALNSP